MLKECKYHAIYSLKGNRGGEDCSIGPKRWVLGASAEECYADARDSELLTLWPDYFFLCLKSGVVIQQVVIHLKKD